MDTSFISYIYLLLIISFLVMLAQRLKISYPIVLVLAGLVLSFIPGLPSIEIDPDLIFVIFLPPLLYEAAWQTSWKELWRWRRVISSFAFIIVLVTSCVVAFVSSSVIPGFTLALGFLLGGIVSPPDAVSATSIMRSIKVPKRVVSIAEGESLLNDAASIIVFRFALAAVDTGKFVFSEAAASFFIVIIMGVLTGLAIALIFYAIHRWLPTTPSIDIVLTFVTPYIMYIVAERFHFSGVLAVVSGGLFLSSRQRTILSPLSRIQGFNVWTIVSFVLNGLIFLMIGLELPVIVNQLGNTSLREAIRYGLIISFTLIIARLLCTLGASVFTRFISRYITTADNNPGWKGPIILGWAGMRGVVSLAAALSIPLYMSNHQLFPQRNLILFITFSVILVTLVFQGLTLPLMIRWIRMEDPDHFLPGPEQEILVRKKLAGAALNLLNSKHEEKVASNELLQGLKQRFANDSRLLEHTYVSNQSGNTDYSITEFKKIANEIISTQRELLQKLNGKAEVDEDIIKKYHLVLDHEEEKLRQQFDRTE